LVVVAGRKIVVDEEGLNHNDATITTKNNGELDGMNRIDGNSVFLGRRQCSLDAQIGARIEFVSKSISAIWLRGALGIGLSALLPLLAGATTVVSSTRTISVQSTTLPLQSTTSTRTTPGAFFDSVSVGTTDTSTSAQDSSLTETAALLHVSGNGSTEAARTITGGTSVAHVGDSVFETNFALLYDTPYQLTGRLTIAADVPLGGSPSFDNSLASVQLMEVGGPSLFFDDLNGSFSKVGVLAGGKTYQLRIVSKIDLRTNQIFNKANGWSMNFLASLVPEPSCIMLAGLMLGPVLLCTRLGRR
jgi:hypothetical protein